MLTPSLEKKSISPLLGIENISTPLAEFKKKNCKYWDYIYFRPTDIWYTGMDGMKMDIKFNNNFKE